MRRRLSAALCAVSLLISVVACALWVRSYWASDVAGVASPTPIPHSDAVWSSAGFLSYRHWDLPANSGAQVQSPGWLYGRQPSTESDNARYLASPRDARRLLGVTYFDSTFKPRGGSPLSGMRERVLLVPYCLVLVVFGVLPTARLLSRRRRLRAARSRLGLCLSYGYDLRASPERCPECGAAVAVAVAAR